MQRWAWMGCAAAALGLGCWLEEAGFDETIPDVDGRVEAGSPGDPGSSDERESACFSYCRIFRDTCADFRFYSYPLSDDVLDDELDCASICYQSVLPLGEGTDTEGNTIYCRVYHAGLASRSALAAERQTHCGHAAEEPLGGCIAR